MPQTNTLTVSFTPCEPAPLNGYKIFYRPNGSSIPYRNGGTFTTSPAVITDNNGDPLGTQYEGYIQSIGEDCEGDPVNFSTVHD